MNFFAFRHNLLSSLFAAGCLALLGICARAHAATHVSSPLADKKLNERVNALLSKMTLDEKIGQLVQYTAGLPTGPSTHPQDYKTMIAAGEVGSLFNVTDAQTMDAYQRIAVEKSRLHIPLLFGQDVIHGYNTTFPVPLGMAATFDPVLVESAARMAAIEASNDGVRWAF